ncbi:MAG: thiamine pyrophosphate-dependent enzyme, partial [Acidimicrobiales bacterium]
DPEQVGRATRADVGLLGNVRAGVAAMADGVRRRGMDDGLRSRRQERVDRLAESRREAKAAEMAAAAGASPVRIEELAAVLGDVLPEDAVVVDEGVRSSRPLLRHLPIGPSQRLLRSSGGALGWGTPAAVGAKIGAPGRPVVAVVGDGSFQFSLQALWSAAQAGAALTVVVLDNGGYLAVKRAIEGHLGVDHDPRVHPGTEITGLDHAEIARGYGARTVSPVDAESLRKGLVEGIEGDAVTVVHLPVAQVRP